MYLITTRELVNNGLGREPMPAGLESQKSAEFASRAECQAWADQIGAGPGREFVIYSPEFGERIGGSSAGESRLFWRDAFV